MKFIKKHPILIIFWLIVLGYIYWNYLRPVSINTKIDKESIHYVNDMYFSNGMIYDKVLKDNEQRLYMTLLKDTSKNRMETKFEGQEYDCDVFNPSGENGCSKLVEKVINAMIIDHPELIQ